MKFFEKLGRVLVENIAYTVVLVLGLILFLYFAGGDLIAGTFTAISALVVYSCIALLYIKYKKLPNNAPVKVTNVKAKKSVKRNKK